MPLKPQSIRKGVKILIDGEEASKEVVITISYTWSESQTTFFKKMLKQGGEFKIKGLKYRITPKPKIVNSKGVKDGGVIIVPGYGERY